LELGEEQTIRPVDEDRALVGLVGRPVGEQIQDLASRCPSVRCGQSEPQISRSGRVATRAWPSGATELSGPDYATRYGPDSLIQQLPKRNRSSRRRSNSGLDSVM
jgi:hypothetical protein